MSWYISVVNKRILPCDNWWFYTTVSQAYKLLKQQIILRACQQASTRRILFSVEILRCILPCIPPGFDMISHQKDCSWNIVGLLCIGLWRIWQGRQVPLTKKRETKEMVGHRSTVSSSRTSILMSYQFPVDRVISFAFFDQVDI